jgi:EAL domain-containing protein (putative c-di-GMP-specific phosphodiesterase class I)
VKTDSLNTERDWQELQETKGHFIVLDSNDVIVSCNDKAKQSLLFSHNHDVFPPDCFWLDAEQRTFHVREFKKIVGKEIRLLFMPSDCDAYRVKILVEKILLFGQEYHSLFIQEDPQEFGLENISTSYRMAQALKSDLKNNLLELHYQPQINIVDNSLYGVEVLARWTSKEFGRVAPDDFIALAEEFEIISELDLWVLRNACQQLETWRKLNINISVIAINFSPISFNIPGIENIIRFVLDETGISPSKLVLEITENKKNKAPDVFVDAIKELSSMGINISLDDFGTGYSNLKRLLKAPVSQLKLDRSFVSELPSKRSQELSEVVLSICKKINAIAIAEGVETQEQLYYLKSMGYEIIQGYFFSQPLSRDLLENWIFEKSIN